MVEDRGPLQSLLYNLHEDRLDAKQTALITAAVVLAGALVWGLGLLVFSWLAPGFLDKWNALWGVAGVAFLGSFAIPTPGFTTGLFLALRSNPGLAVAAVLGATFGATLGAALLVLAGHALRKKLERKATKGKIARWFLKWAKKLVTRFAYGGVVLLLSLPFVPRAVVLYASSLLHLRPAPLLLSILLGHFLRYALYMSLVAGVFSAWID